MAADDLTIAERLIREGRYNEIGQYKSEPIDLGYHLHPKDTGRDVIFAGYDGEGCPHYIGI